MRPALIGRRNPVCLLRHAAEQTNASMTNALKQTRRETLLLGAAALVSSLVQNVEAGHDTERHGISAFGDLKYPPDFKHFDYVNPNAPKGGVFSHTGATRAFNQNFLTFNSLNSFILKGDGAQGMELNFASLMARAEDEPDALYGLAARAVQISPDGLTYRFLLRPMINFHDGSPLTAHDVAFSLKILKDKGHPIAQQLLRDFDSAEAPDEATVVVRFAAHRARDVPLFVAALPIFSRSYYAARRFDETTLEVPLGSGPYKVGRFEPGRHIEYERVKDWWGADLPVGRGQNNFDIVRYEYYRDRAEAICSGKNLHRGLGRHATTSRRSARGTSSAMLFQTIPPPARRVGSSIPDGKNCRISICGRLSSMHSISNGPTRRSCTGPMKGRIPCFRIPT
jgi:microcin C transport system substrate-binding protein